MYLGIFQETNITDVIYTCRSDGYSVIATDATSQRCGGVSRTDGLWWMAPHFAVDAVQNFDTNFVGLQMATGGRRWYIVGCYLASDDTSMLESVVVALKELLRGAELLAVGDFNLNLSET